MWPNFDFEQEQWSRGAIRVGGVDEAGRGPLAGPVIAAAVILAPEAVPEGIRDSKTLPADRRTSILAQITAQADVGIGEASVEEIDRLNILRASHLAMCRAVEALRQRPCHALIDGNLIPRDLALPATAIVKGDALSLSIAAASIVAKTRRDAIMWDLAQQYPGYGWETNQGYPTKCHKSALENLGVTPHHRRSFKPVYQILCQENFVTS
ncbi:ribonuclease HII [Marivita sp. GX14005]|uniref:ribonuclease HII n=1 Tax=Marivita sp. GX14005 TaxID=2942276 RepID=UPI00201958F4|nr:ribonuclease HII [Marivita sp. GX14005]MCL3881917.1 ribonuclease HII [Marivita sp. GX14005]